MSASVIRALFNSLALSVVLAAGAGARAEEWSARAERVPLPAALSTPVQALLSDEAIVISKAGAPVYTYWPARAVRLAAAPASMERALEQVAEISLLGALRVHAEGKDYRGDALPAGDYTMRLGLRPEDRSHRNVSDFTSFGILLPAAKDKRAEGYKNHDALAEASAEETDEFHPAIISLRPDATPDVPVLSVVSSAEAHRAIRIVQPAKAGDTAASLSFEFVVEGQGRR